VTAVERRRTSEAISTRPVVVTEASARPTRGEEAAPIRPRTAVARPYTIQDSPIWAIVADHGLSLSGRLVDDPREVEQIRSRIERVQRRERAVARIVDPAELAARQEVAARAVAPAPPASRALHVIDRIGAVLYALCAGMIVVVLVARGWSS
jgi:hypothetical protein